MSDQTLLLRRWRARSLLVATSLACLFLAGCHRRPADCAQIRLIDAISDADEVQVGMSGAFEKKTLAFRQSIPYVSVPAGSYQTEGTADRRGTISFPLPARVFTVIAKRQYTALAMGTYEGSPAPVVHLFEEPPSEYPLADNQILVRVVNASPDASRIDILLNNLVAFKNLPYDRMSYASALPAGRYACVVKLAGDRFVPLNIPLSLTLRSRRSYLLVVLGRVRDGSVSVEPYEE